MLAGDASAASRRYVQACVLTSGVDVSVWNIDAVDARWRR